MATETMVEQSGETRHHPFVFNGQGSEFFGIWIVNILLSIITLGIYSAWAKVRTHQYFYGNTQLDGDHFEYLATPVQILIGRFIAVGVLVVLGVLSTTAPEISVIFLLVIAACTPILVVRNLRFDARISRFRGVCFDFKGQYGGAYLYLLLYPLLAYFGVVLFTAIIGGIGYSIAPVLGFILGAIALVVSMTFAYAWVGSMGHRYIANNYWYGNKPFAAEITISSFIKIALLSTGLLSILALIIGVLVSILGGALILEVMANPEIFNVQPMLFFKLVLPIYVVFILGSLIIGTFVQISIRNYVLSQIRIDELALSSTVSRWGFVWLMLTNVLLVICTLSLGKPWVMARTMRYLAQGTAVDGDLSLADVSGSVGEPQLGIADELSNALNVEIGAF